MAENYDYNLYKMYSKDIIRNGEKLDRNKRTGTGNDSSGKGNDGKEYADHYKTGI